MPVLVELDGEPADLRAFGGPDTRTRRAGDELGAEADADQRYALGESGAR